MDLLGFNGKSSLPSLVKDPFLKDKVTDIDIHYSCNYSGKWSCWATVEFKNGNTSGKQRFDGETFDDVVLDIKRFLETLK